MGKKYYLRVTGGLIKNYVAMKHVRMSALIFTYDLP